MQCIRCGCEKIFVSRSVKRGIQSDVRRCECAECGLIMWTATTITSVEHYDHRRRKLLNIPLADYIAKILPAFLTE